MVCAPHFKYNIVKLKMNVKDDVICHTQNNKYMKYKHNILYYVYHCIPVIYDVFIYIIAIVLFANLSPLPLSPLFPLFLSRKYTGK